MTKPVDLKGQVADLDALVEDLITSLSFQWEHNHSRACGESPSVGHVGFCVWPTPWFLQTARDRRDAITGRRKRKANEHA